MKAHRYGYVVKRGISYDGAAILRDILLRSWGAVEDGGEIPEELLGKFEEIVAGLELGKTALEKSMKKNPAIMGIPERHTHENVSKKWEFVPETKWEDTEWG